MSNLPVSFDQGKREYANEPDNENSADNLKALASFVAREKPYSTALERAKEEVVADYKDELKVVRLAVVRRRIARIFKMMDAVEKIEDELMNDVRFTGANNKEVIALVKAVSEQLEATMNMIQSLIEETKDTAPTVTPIADNRTVNFTFNADPSDKDSREKIRNFFDTVLKKYNLDVPTAETKDAESAELEQGPDGSNQ